jgi:hypothetical protein
VTRKAEAAEKVEQYRKELEAEQQVVMGAGVKRQARAHKEHRETEFL